MARIDELGKDFACVRTLDTFVQTRVPCTSKTFICPERRDGLRGGSLLSLVLSGEQVLGLLREAGAHVFEGDALERGG